MRVSLKIKDTINVAVLSLALSVTAITISYNTYKNTMEKHYVVMADNLAETVVSVVDNEDVYRLKTAVMDRYEDAMEAYGGIPDMEQFTQEDWSEFWEYFSDVEEMPEYQSLQVQLDEIGRVNDVAAVYLCYADPKIGRAIYLVDGLLEDPSLPGDSDPCTDEQIRSMENGIYDLEPFISNFPEYGWLVTSTGVIYDASGEYVCTAMIDISMDEVVTDRLTFLRKLALVLGSITILALLGAILFVINTVVRPVTKLAEIAEGFVSKGYIDSAYEVEGREIRYDDEIGDLYQAILKMKLDIVNYMENLTAVTAEKERIGAELDVATQIQADMLPSIFPPFPERKEFDIYATMEPAKEVGGDFYDFFLIDDDHLALVIADVSGKGVPAALFMVIAKTLLKNKSQSGGSPAEILEDVNNQLCEGNKAELFVTVWLAIIQISTGEGVAANAGHEHPVIKRAGGDFELVKYRHSPALAAMEGIPFREHTFKLDPGDRLYVYTDGVTEATNARAEMYREDRMVSALNRNKEKGLKELLTGVREDIRDFVKDAPQFDDITMLAMDYYGSQKGAEDGTTAD